MKLWLRIFLGTALALAGAAVTRAQVTPSAVSASPASALPGDQVTFAVTVSNAGGVINAGTTDISIALTNTTTGLSFTVSQSAVPAVGQITAFVAGANGAPGTPGSGTFNLTVTIPSTTAAGVYQGKVQAGPYRATVTMNNFKDAGVATANPGPYSFSVSSTVLTITGKPDLQITRLDYLAGTSFVGGQTLVMALDYRNNQSTNGTQNVPYVPGQTGFPSFFRIQVVLSSNPTFGDADDFQLTIHDVSSLTNADGATHTLNWTQVLPGNFSGSYYVLAKIDSLNAVSQNDPPALNVNGNNVWGGNSLNPSGTLINLLPSNFPTNYLASHGNGVATSATGYSDNPSISSDGRYTAFASDAANLVANDTNSARDIFVFDSQTSLVRRLSVSQQGSQGNGASNNPAVSANGRYVAFESNSTNLVLGDTNGFSDIFVVDIVTGLIARVSGANASGGQANNPSFRPAISTTGRYIVFESTATNLTASATAVGVSHVYLYDRDVSGSGTFDTVGNTATKLIDSDVTTPLTVAGNANAIMAKISSDGTMVAFASKATNLVSPATTASRQHVYVRPTANVGTSTSGIRNVSVVTTSAAEGNADSQTPSLSSNGRYVAFASLATNLVTAASPGGLDTNGVSDIFVYDTNQPVATPIVRRISLTNSGTQGTDPSAAGFQLGSINPTISSDGRYVAFASLDSNLTAGDTNGQYQATDSNNALDIFVRDRDSAATGTFDTGATATTMVSVNPFGYQTNGLLGIASTAASNIYPVISADGRFVAFPTDAENNAGLAFGATNLLPLDSNSLRDVFLFDRRTNATVTPATPPTVTITNPGNGGTALVNTPISVTATATTTVGVVSSVQFFVNGTSLGTSSVFPYSQTWTPTAVGSYTLSALVTDSFGNLGVSTNVAVTINAAPSVGITAPIGGTSIVVGTVTTVGATAAASNPGAFMSTVQFFANGASLGTVTAPANSVSFTPTVSWTPAATGNVTLTAVAIDSIGTQITSPSVAVTITAVAGSGGGSGGSLSSPPTVSLLRLPPATAAVNTPIALTATATASSGFTLSNVQYLANGVSIGSSSAFPYAVTWTPTAIGTYSITAVATDNVGTKATSAAASVAISAGTAPTISLVSPATGTSYAVGSPIALSASTSLGAGLIASVDFFANNVAIGSKSASATGQGSAPFFNLEWSPAAAGTYVFYAVVTDTSGNRTVSASVTVTVASVSAPVLTLTSPTSGTTLTVNQTQTITASATAGTGASIASVAFFANSQSLGSDTTFPYSAAWTPTAPGTYTLRAVATDSFGTQTTSSTVSVTVGAGSTSLPFVYLTSVPTGTNVAANTPVYVTANAGDPDGTVANVEFFANGSPIGAKATAPYAITWVPTTATSYSITAVVTDNAGNRVTSAASTITALVQVGVAPVAGIAFNNPTVDASTSGTATSLALFTPVKVDYGSKLIISASAVDQDGSIANVQFFANGTSLATIGAAPYYTTYTLNTLSDVTLTAIVTDNSGNAIYTTPILVSTQSANPTGDLVTLVSPLNGSTYITGGQIIFSATHNFGAVSPPKIDFYVNGSQFTTVSTAPYQFLVGLTRAGTYDIHAVLRQGNTTTISTPARITVTSNTAPTVSIRSPSNGGSYVIGTALTISANAADSDGTIQDVKFFVNGNALSTAAAAPYNAVWTPSSPGIYTLTAAATDNAGNQTLSSPVTVTYTGNAPPAVSLSTPSVGARVVAGSAISLVASASDADGTVTSVRFLANGTVVGTGSTAPFTATWTPTAPGIYSVIAQATDNSGNVTSSTAVSVNVLANQPPVVSLSSPANGTLLRTGASTGLVATASDPDGTVASVQFLANGNVVGTVTTAPYTATWTPSSPGTYTVIAQATDNTGNVASSTAASVTVLPNQLPIVSLTSPANGAVVRAGISTTLSATATDSDGAIASVQFFANGVSLGAPITTVTTNGYRTQWTPTAEGIYTITATAIDNSGAAVSTTSTVLAVSAAGGGDSVFSGALFGLGESGQFAIINVGRKSAAFLGYSTIGAGKVYFYPSIPVSASGNFSLTDSTGRVLIAGKFDANDTSATITTLDGAVTTQIGIASFTGSSSATGYYTGSLSGRAASQLAAIVGPDGAIMLVATDGTARTAGAGFIDSTGAFVGISAQGGGAFTGKIDPTTKFLSGNLTGPIAGGLLGALESGVSFSDGFLRNLSSRGQVGTGTNVLVAGFVVGGTTPKQILVRAIGPSLTQFGITGALTDPQLQLFGGVGGSVLVASNDNWGGGAALATASNSVGAFPLSASSLDAVVLATLAPGNYTAQVSGVSAATGTALVELYDVDSPTPFSSQKVINISTRAVVGTGQNRLIAGFVISGNTAKKVLVRAVGPTLGAAPFNVPGVLADPVLRIIRNSDNLVVRENDNWEIGNDATLISDAAVRTGAFALATGGKDAAILISLPPGSYSAEVTGTGTTTGIALVEVYEVP